MAMASISKFLPGVHLISSNPVSLYSSLVALSFPSYCTSALSQRRLFALKSRSDGGETWSQEVYGSDFVRKPVISLGKELDGISAGGEEVEEREQEKWVDWEDQILEDTVPLVSFVRMILHSAKYGSGERLIPEHERTILDKLLHYHPEVEKKIGCGIDYITVGYHPDFETSRCLFIVRKDGELVDFSYWKCIKGLIRKKYPLYADSFILRYFRQGRRNL